MKTYYVNIKRLFFKWTYVVLKEGGEALVVLKREVDLLF